MRVLVLLLTLLAGPVLFAGENVPEPNRFASEIRTFEQWDSKNSYPSDAVLFVGSSSIRMWETHKSFPDLPLINRGFGGSHISDVIFYFNKVVLPYKPRLIIFYAGDNDIASDKSPKQVLNDFQKFVSMVEENLPQTPVIFISIKPSESRWNFWPASRQANEMIRLFCEKNNRLTFVDAGSVLLNADGKVNNEFFLSDKLHMNEKGYRKWTQILRPVIEREFVRKDD
jgi:lysophospholipase L1-like esterase